MASNQLSYGQDTLRQLGEERINQNNTQTVDTAINQIVMAQSASMMNAMSLFAEPTILHKERFLVHQQPTMQPMDDDGEPYPIRPTSWYDVAYPIDGGGVAFANNRISRAMETAADVNRYMNTMISADTHWMQHKLLSALLDNGTRTYSDEQYGSLTVQPLANDDGSKYAFTGGSLMSHDDVHHIAQAAAISATTASAIPFSNIFTELKEHPNNAGNVICFVAENLEASVKAITVGNNGNGFVHANVNGIIPPNTDARISGNPSNANGIGTFLGYQDGCWVYSWSALPSNYIVATTDNQLEPVLKYREYDAPELKGLFREVNDKDGNHRTYKFLRYGGFGVHDRTGAVVYFVSAGDTTYDVPSGYDRPDGL